MPISRKRRNNRRTKLQNDITYTSQSEVTHLLILGKKMDPHRRAKHGFALYCRNNTRVAVFRLVFDN